MGSRKWLLEKDLIFFNLPLRGQGDWNIDTCKYAAKNGHLHVLKWARENGC